MTLFVELAACACLGKEAALDMTEPRTGLTPQSAAAPADLCSVSTRLPSIERLIGPFNYIIGISKSVLMIYVLWFFHIEFGLCFCEFSSASRIDPEEICAFYGGGRRAGCFGPRTHVQSNLGRQVWVAALHFSAISLGFLNHKTAKELKNEFLFIGLSGLQLWPVPFVVAPCSSCRQEAAGKA